MPIKRDRKKSLKKSKKIIQDSSNSKKTKNKIFKYLLLNMSRYVDILFKIEPTKNFF